MLFYPQNLTLTILGILFSGAFWFFVDVYFIKKEIRFISFIPLLILIICLVISSAFFTKVYVIEPSTHHTVLFVCGDYVIKTEDGQKVPINYSAKSSITIINSTVFDIDFYGIVYGDTDFAKPGNPAIIHAHSFHGTNVTPDVFPDEKIPNWIRIQSNGNDHYTISNVLQFQDPNVLSD